MSISRSLVALTLAGCAASGPKANDAAPVVVDAAPPPVVVVDAAAPPPPPPVVDAGPPPAPPKAAPKVKVENIGMHVGGGPFDEPTKEPFKKAVGPHHPKMAECWAEHVTRTKPADVGVDLLIEAAGGKPKVSNPRVRFEKTEEDGKFTECLVAVFEAIEFPKLDRGKSGVSYSLRFTPTP